MGEDRSLYREGIDKLLWELYKLEFILLVCLIKWEYINMSQR